MPVTTQNIESAITWEWDMKKLWTLFFITLPVLFSKTIQNEVKISFHKHFKEYRYKCKDELTIIKISMVCNYSIYWKDFLSTWIIREKEVNKERKEMLDVMEIR